MSPFRPTRTGAWGVLEAEFFSAIPPAAELYWVTYSLTPDERTLRALGELGATLRIICQHPCSDSDVQVGMRPEVWDQIMQHLGHAEDRILGYSSPPPVGDGEESPLRLHSKFIVARFEKGVHEVYSLASGSFNLARASLGFGWEGNHETVTLIRDQGLARLAWDEAEWLSVRCEPVLREHCVEDPRGSVDPQPIQFENTPARTGTRDVQDAPEPVAIDDPEVLCQLQTRLDGMLRDFPPGCDRQYQIYCELEAAAEKSSATGRRDVLYLPVGVGKTFIALRWLVYHLHRHYQETGQLWFGLYLCPNQWIESTIQAALENLCSDGAHPLNIDEVRRRIVIVRPSGVDSEQEPVAVVADECHNWNPDGQGRTLLPGRHSYTSALNVWRDQDVPILGLSATPCRLEQGCFSPTSFIEAFVHPRPVEPDDCRPYMSLEDAVEEGFLCHHEFEELSLPRARQEEVLEVLTSGDDRRFVTFGDYSQTTLRAVWDVLSSDVDHLVRNIVRAFRGHLTRRAVVFLPPVEGAADRFVERLGRSLSEPRLFFDFRSRAVGDPLAAFEGFREARPRPGTPAVLVTVDRFGEGVSINDIDMLVMLRATLSPRVAVQALGRGLRVDGRKERCVILDAVHFEERLKLWDCDDWEALAAEAAQHHRGSQPAPKPRRTPAKKMRSPEPKKKTWAYRTGVEGRLVKVDSKSVAVKKARAKSLRDTRNCYVFRMVRGNWEEQEVWKNDERLR